MSKAKSKGTKIKATTDSKPTDKGKALGAALEEIERSYGKGSIMRLGDNSIPTEVRGISTGSIQLDIGRGHMLLREWEPFEGFQDVRRQRLLLEQQAKKAKTYLDWWRSVQDRAEWDGKRWRIPSEEEPQGSNPEGSPAGGTQR